MQLMEECSRVSEARLNGLRASCRRRVMSRDDSPKPVCRARHACFTSRNSRNRLTIDRHRDRRIWQRSLVAKQREGQQRLALLVDADNTPPGVVDGLLAEAARFGSNSGKRVYGDWASPPGGPFQSEPCRDRRGNTGAKSRLSGLAPRHAGARRTGRRAGLLLRLQARPAAGVLGHKRECLPRGAAGTQPKSLDVIGRSHRSNGRTSRTASR